MLKCAEENAKFDMHVVISEKNVKKDEKFRRFKIHQGWGNPIKKIYSKRFHNW